MLSPIHLGRTNPNHIYYINSKNLQNVNKAKDLSIIIDNQLKFHSHASSVSSKAHQLLAFFNNLLFTLIQRHLHIYNYSIVWPTLEYGDLIWGSFYLLDQQQIERVQRKATTLIREISHFQYKERLLLLKLYAISTLQEVSW